MFLAMNLDACNGLSPGQQTAIDELSGRQVSDDVAMFYDTASAAAAERNAAAGIVKIRLDDAQLEEWQEATRDVVEDWIADNGGDFEARAMYERMLELATD
jgi:TRAP-type C4-dicarboxylate transport system substrate-binding protein